MCAAKPKELFEVHVRQGETWKTVGSFGSQNDAFAHLKQIGGERLSFRIVREHFDSESGLFKGRKVVAEKIQKQAETGGASAAKARRMEQVAEERAARLKGGGSLIPEEAPPEERSIFEMFVETRKAEKASDGSGRAAGKGFGKG